MAAIWRKDSGTWRPLATTGFHDEAALHDLIEEAPRMLPLSGQPAVVVLGREVQLGKERADLIAVERDGRLVAIEIKLADNPEARRGVVSQVLSYASSLHGIGVAELETILSSHLKKNGWSGLVDGMSATDQEGSFEEADFLEALRLNLSEGAFRLVIVLDEAPHDLVRIVGYLQKVAPNVLVDLITVSTFDIGGTPVMVPQRIDPSRHEDDRPTGFKAKATAGVLMDGAEPFIAAIEEAPQSEQPRLRTLAEWAQSLEREKLVELSTYKGTTSRWTLLPRFQPENAGLVTIYNEKGASLQLWRSVFEKKARSFTSARRGGTRGRSSGSSTVRRRT